MLDEGHWYGPGWPRLRRALVSLAVRESPDLLAELAGPGDPGPAVDAYLERLLRAVARRQMGAPEGMWSFAMAPLADAKNLAQRVQKDRDALRGAETRADGEHLLPAAAFGQVMSMFLNDGVTSLGGQGRSHESRVWSRIRHESDELAREAAVAGHPMDDRERGAPEHIRQVYERLRAKFPNDHNLPRTLETCEAYFEWHHEDGGRVNADDVRIIERATDFRPDLDACLQALLRRDSRMAEAIAAKFGVAIGTVDYINAHAFRTARGITRGGFERLVAQAWPLLAACVERAVKGHFDVAVSRLEAEHDEN